MPLRPAPAWYPYHLKLPLFCLSWYYKDFGRNHQMCGESDIAGKTHEAGDFEELLNDGDIYVHHFRLHRIIYVTH